MALRFEVAALTDVPEGFRSEYEAKDGKYVLKTEGQLPGFVPESRLSEETNKLISFRDNNIRLLKALGVENGSIDSAVERANVVRSVDPVKLAAVKDIDPEEYRRLKEQAAKLQADGVKDNADVQKLIQQALETGLNPVKEQLSKTQKELADKQSKLDRSTFRQAVGDAAIKAGARPSAIDFLLTKAQDVFSVEDGEVKAKPGKFSTVKAGDPLSIDEWIGTQTKESDFAFQPSNGGGASTKTGGLTGKVLINPTPEQLGEHSAAILKGDIKVQHTLS